MANITQRSNGKWQAKIRRQGHPDQSKTFQTLNSAQAWARAIEREMDIGAFVQRDDAERTTFKDAAERYENEVLPSKRGKESDRCRLRLLVNRFGKFSLASINQSMVAVYRDERLKVVAPQTVTHELGMLSRVFKCCVLDWGIALPQGIPTATVRKPSLPRGRDRRIEAGEWEPLRASLAACKSIWPLAVVEFAIETAARQAEVMALVWQDVDLKNKTARLRGNGGGVTKNGDPYRDIPLSPRAVAVLTALPRAIKGPVFNISQSAMKQSWERAVARGRKTHVYGRLRDALIATGVDQKTIDKQISALTYHKKKAEALTVKLMAKIDATDNTLVDLHFHDLRHEATSKLAEKLQLHELMKVTGHRSSSMLGRYYHPRASDLAAKLA